jgi:hypothetical protein
MITEHIHACPSPSNNDSHTGQEYQPVIHQLRLYWPRLRVASPAHDERGGGNLGLPVHGILTQVTLLIPAFVLLATPVLTFRRTFTVTRTLPYHLYIAT